MLLALNLHSLMQMNAFEVQQSFFIYLFSCINKTASEKATTKKSLNEVNQPGCFAQKQQEQSL